MESALLANLFREDLNEDMNKMKELIMKLRGSGEKHSRQDNNKYK